MSLDPGTRSSEQLQLVLPAKIAGIVFWGMVLVGLVFAGYLIQLRQTELKSITGANCKLFGKEIEHALAQSTNHEETIRRLKKTFEAGSIQYGVEAITITLKDERVELGVRNPSQNECTQTIHVAEHAEKLQWREIEVQLYQPDLQQAITKLRNNLLIVVGSMVFIFGLVLQQILQRLLSKPFTNMVLTAERFGNGELQIRFDQERSDEFGYLAKFINRALDSMVQQRLELEQSRQTLYEEKERVEVTLQSIMDSVITLNAQGYITYLNPVAQRMCNCMNASGTYKLKQLFEFIDEDSREILSNPVDLALQENTSIDLPPQAALLRRDNRTIPIEAKASPMRDNDGNVTGVVLVVKDVSHSRRLTRQLSWQASHDSLTGLYNRRMFEEHLQELLDSTQEKNKHHALMYIDLDQFKIVNDTCGHMAGDELLRQVVVLIQEGIRGEDFLARLGGDEFGILLKNCSSSNATLIADKIRLRMQDFRFAWQDKSFEIGASIGVVAINSDNLDLASILSAADVACYAAKDMGRNRVHVYEPTDSFLADRHGQMHWTSRIVQALENQQMVLFQQPIIALRAGHEDHCEILVRMRDSNDEYIPPSAFIPAAERYTLMPKIDRWVIENTFQMLLNVGFKSKKKIVAINLSGNSLGDDGLLNFIRESGQHYGVNFQYICFEITETAAIANLSKATHFINELRQLGCRFALDDFGSGLSSFGYLKNLPVDYVKIDGAFVKNMSTDPIDLAMVEAITRVAHVMQIKTIAEWVEDETTLQLLKSLGVDFAQGYHLGKPTGVI